MGYSLFQSSVLGMMSQAHALDTISTNIANVTTGGYKRTDTRFATVLSSNVRTGPGADSSVSFANQERGLGGSRPKDFQTVDQQGLLQATERSTDVAIAGGGFFQVSPDLAVSGDVLFTRDGSFDISVAGAPVTVTGDNGDPIQVREGYLTDKNGFFLLGTVPDALGTFASPTTLQALRVDQFAFINQFTQTTNASMNANLPSSTEFGQGDELVSMNIVDSLGQQRAVNATFVKTTTENQWQMLLSGDNLTTSVLSPGSAFSLSTGAGTGRIMVIDPATQSISIKSEFIPAANSPGHFVGLQVGDSITVAGSTGNNGTFTISAISDDFSNVTLAAGSLAGGSETITTAASLASSRVVGDPIVFSPTGTLQTPQSINVSLTFAAGGDLLASTSSFALDMSRMTQFDGAFTFLNFTQDGLAQSNLRSVGFDSAGHVLGNFEDGTARRVYKLALATFSNPNALEARNGNVYAETTESGTPRSVFADVTGIALLQPNTVELSNVDLAGQFTSMIKVQQAYNSSATTFKTIDEMTIVARDLKA